VIGLILSPLADPQQFRFDPNMVQPAMGAFFPNLKDDFNASVVIESCY